MISCPVLILEVSKKGGNMEKFSKTAIISFVISLFSLYLFISVLYQFNALILWFVSDTQFNTLILWIIASIVAILFPFYSKYRRMKSGAGGKWLEVSAFAIGVIECYIIIFFGFGLNAFLVDILAVLICLLYRKLFNNIVPESSDMES